ncbi:hypothetical protein An14g02120 [Aspergillus niger]|uniref:Uncharacterized protein n=2 Tax=Aspergillus niger TaxID=5061 RepID=A2R2V8_ASPNC|nr:hypothetical protein An14g02120 [Aspergillus niger]CAK41949.1 hypothetical protein An14g02120 [Aspergillus niger]
MLSNSWLLEIHQESHIQLQAYWELNTIIKKVGYYTVTTYSGSMLDARRRRLVNGLPLLILNSKSLKYKPCTSMYCKDEIFVNVYLTSDYKLNKKTNSSNTRSSDPQWR